MTRTRVALVAGMIGVAGITASPSSQQNPFDRLWNAVLDLSARVTLLENAPPSGTGSGGPVVVDVNGVVIGGVVDTTTATTTPRVVRQMCPAGFEAPAPRVRHTRSIRRSGRCRCSKTRCDSGGSSHTMTTDAHGRV
jgi:hypothetical protein